MNMNLNNILKNHIFSGSLNDISFKTKCIINTLNPHSYCLAKKDDNFKNALLNSNILLPDGSGIILASRVLNKNKIKKIAGADIHNYLLDYANKKEKKLFYLGSSKNVLNLIVSKIHKQYPKIKVETYSPPFKNKFSKEESKKMIKAINSFGTDILFVGMTAPKQEKWVEQYKNLINAEIISSIGAVFDFYSGTIKRSNPFWIKLGLEWLPRFLKEPRRLWKRNFISTPLFIFYIAYYKIKK